MSQKSVLVLGQDPKIITQISQYLAAEHPKHRLIQVTAPAQMLNSPDLAGSLVVIESGSFTLDYLRLIRKLSEARWDADGARRVLIVSELLAKESWIGSDELFSFHGAPLSDSELRQFFEATSGDEPETKTFPQEKPAPETKPSLRRSRIDGKFFMTFHSAISLVYQVAARGQLEPAGITVRKTPVPEMDIGCTMNLKSKYFEGTLSILMQKDGYIQLANTIQGEHETEINPGNIDVIREIGNQVFGFLKTELNSQGYAFELAIPELLQGESIALGVPQAGTIVTTMTFDSKYGRVVMDIQVHKLLSS